jgi:hypothetical protein
MSPFVFIGPIVRRQPPPQMPPQRPPGWTDSQARDFFFPRDPGFPWWTLGVPGIGYIAGNAYRAAVEHKPPQPLIPGTGDIGTALTTAGAGFLVFGPLGAIGGLGVALGANLVGAATAPGGASPPDPRVIDLIDRLNRIDKGAAKTRASDP